MEQTSPVTTIKGTLDYYLGLNPEKIKEDVELMKVASVKELYELIASNCRHYVSLIEHYKEDNLQTLCQMSIHRIEGHLLIKFRFYASNPWVEVGFMDDSNTDEETLTELKRVITLQLKHQEKNDCDRRQHLVAQIDSDHDLKSEFDDPKLQPNAQQLASAGYIPVPEHLKKLEQQLRTPHTGELDLSKISSNVYLDDLKDTRYTKGAGNTRNTNGAGNTKNNKDVRDVRSLPLSGGFQVKMEDQVEQPKRPNEMDRTWSLDPVMVHLDDSVRRQAQLYRSFELVAQRLRIVPTHQHVYLYQYLIDQLSKQDPHVVTDLILELINQVSYFQ